jgi:threonine/homoserine/homoserine lactone efflux protein
VTTSPAPGPANLQLSRASSASSFGWVGALAAFAVVVVLAVLGLALQRARAADRG